MAEPRQTSRHPAFAAVAAEDWEDWRWQMRHRVVDPARLAALIDLSHDERVAVTDRARAFPFAITPYYLSLFGGPDCPVRRQGIPVVAEAESVPWDLDDPLGEDAHSPVPMVSHRYPDRALLYVTHSCPVYCRHCTRARKVGDAMSAPDQRDLARAFDYLRKTPQVRDVLISGGDPLTLSDARLAAIFSALAEIESIDVVRLCTRNPVTLPQRITPALASLLSRRPPWISTHFNHPRECTPEAALALARLADAGCPLSNQMVLLRGINDDADTVETLNRWLVRHRCRPYYMFQCDPIRGTAHLRTPIATGLEIVDALRGRLSGLAIPHFAVDLPGGGGKITLTPDRLVARDGDRLTFRDHRGRTFTYVDAAAGAGPAALPARPRRGGAQLGALATDDADVPPPD